MQKEANKMHNIEFIYIVQNHGNIWFTMVIFFSHANRTMENNNLWKKHQGFDLRM